MKEMNKAFHETCGKKKQFLLHKCLILKIIYFFQKVQCSFCTLLTSHRGSDSGPPVICQTCWLFLLKMPVQGGSTIDQCNQGPMLQRAHQVLCRENTFRSIPVTEGGGLAAPSQVSELHRSRSIPSGGRRRRHMEG